MCDIKKYTGEMLAARTQVAFRLDFFSMPSFYSEYPDMLSKKYHVENFNVRELSGTEQQQVDVDSVSESMDSSVGEIIEKKNYILRGLQMDNIPVKADVFISPYYVFAELIEAESHIEDAGIIKQFIDGLLLYENEKSIDMQDTSLYMRHVVERPSLEELFTIVDRTAFPILEDKGTLNGWYSDTREAGKYDANLVRVIRQGETDGNPMYQMTVMSKVTPNASFYLNQFEELGAAVAEMFEVAMTESTRFFKG